MLNQKILADAIERSVVQPLRRGECGLKRHEITALVRMTCHVEQNISEVCNLTGWSARTLERRWKEGDFPKPHKFQSERPLWWLDEVEIWLAEHNNQEQEHSTIDFMKN